MRKVILYGHCGIVPSAGSLQEAEEIASNDPIHKEGISKFQIREWKPVRFMSLGLGEEK